MGAHKYVPAKRRRYTRSATAAATADGPVKFPGLSQLRCSEVRHIMDYKPLSYLCHYQQSCPHHGSYSGLYGSYMAQ